MFFLSYATSVLLFASFILVSVMFAGLLEVALVIGACGAILLTFFDCSNTYCNWVVIV